MVDVLEGKLALARRLGADITLNPGQDDVIEAVKDLTNGLGADVVVEAAGTAESFNTASEIIKHNGKFVFYSWVTTPVTLNISRWHDDGWNSSTPASCTTPGSSVMSGAREALRPVAQGLVDVKAAHHRRIQAGRHQGRVRPRRQGRCRHQDRIQAVTGPGPPIPPPPETESRGLAGRPPASPPVGARRCARKTKEETMITCPDCETGRNLLAGACRSVFQRGLTGRFRRKHEPAGRGGHPRHAHGHPLRAS